MNIVTMLQLFLSKSIVSIDESQFIILILYCQRIIIVKDFPDSFFPTPGPARDWARLGFSSHLPPPCNPTSIASTQQQRHSHTPNCSGLLYNTLPTIHCRSCGGAAFLSQPQASAITTSFWQLLQPQLTLQQATKHQNIATAMHHNHK